MNDIESFGESLRSRVRSHLQRFERHALGTEGLRPAGVAITLIADDDGAACFVITRRARSLREHSGQWALPGGRSDEGEDAASAALRELREEVGLELEPDNVLGLLDDYPTRSGFIITPVVVWADRGTPTPNPEEVESVHLVRLSELERADVPQLRSIPESDRPVISVPLLGTAIHAPTAALLYQLREVALWGRPTRVAHFDQPVFAWK